MATTNPTISGGWNLIVNAGEEFLLTLPQPAQTVFVATSDDDSEPASGLLGHPLAAGQDGMNRALLGLGNVYARCIDAAATVTLALTTWHDAD